MYVVTSPTRSENGATETLDRVPGVDVKIIPEVKVSIW